MKILIAGCGEVGLTLAQQLSAEGHDLTLVDSDSDVLESRTDRFDVMSVQGNCASMATLRRAGVKKSDLLIACTGNDELNLLCCMTAHSMNPALHTIARIHDPDYLEQIYAMRESFGISMTFNPEQQVATEMERLLKYPGFLKREAFMGGRAEIAELKVEEDSKLCNAPLKTLFNIVKCQVLICAILRDGKAIIPDGRFSFYAGDRIFVTASPDNLSQFLKNLGIITRKVRKVIIAGGGTIGFYLAERLIKGGISVTLVERDAERCRELAELLPKATVIEGDVGDQALMESEGIGSADALVSTTGMDELNIITSLYANSCEVPQIITKLGKMEGTGIIDGLPLGSVLSPRQVCCSSIVRYVRAMQNKDGGAVTIHQIADGGAEAIEFRVDADTLYSGVPLKKIRLKRDARIACIARGDEIIIPNGDSSFEIGDSVVIVAGGDEVVMNLNDIFA